MKIENFIQLFAEQFDDVDANSLTPEFKFRDLTEWDSLTALSVIAMVDEEFDVLLKGDDIKESNTIEDLFLKVNSKTQ